MKSIGISNYKMECSQKGDLCGTVQHVQLRYLYDKDNPDQIISRFICGFNNYSDECVKCEARIEAFLVNKSYVPEGKVIASDQTFEEFPPND